MPTTLIIGGTAAYHLEAEWGEERTIRTPFGEAGPVAFFEHAGESCALLSRHGGKGQLGLTPPFINYWANLWVAKEIGARRILSWNSGGGMHRSLSPGTIAVIADLIDWTRRRPTSFQRALAGEGAAALDLPAPTPAAPLFDPAIRIGLAKAAQWGDQRVAPGAVYMASEGARLETKAEIALCARAGAEVVGMTMSPEVFLARELGVPFGSICWISNYATGIPYDGPEQRLFGAEVGPLLFGILKRYIEEANG